MEKRQLVRVLSQKDVVSLAFGAMIGWGWVVLAGDWIAEAGSVGSIFAFLIGGLMVVFVGLTYAELVSAMPKVGGEQIYTLRALGPRYSFVASWGIALGYISVVAFEAVALPTVVDYLFPNYRAVYLWTVAGYDVTLTWALVGVVGAIVITVVNYLGIRPAAVFQGICTLLLALVGVLLIFGSFSGGEPEYFRPFFVNGLDGLLTVLVMTPFLFVGFDVIPQAAEEMKIPSRMIGILLVYSVLFAVIWYIVVIVAVGLGLHPGSLGKIELATADALAALMGHPLFGKILVLGGIAGILTSWNAFFIGGSRILYAMAEWGMLPGWFAKLHPKYKTPSNAILLIGVLSVIAPLFGREMLVWLVDAGGVNIVLSYFLVAVSFLVLRKKEPEMPRPFRAGKGPFVGIVAVILSLFIGVLYLPGMPAALIWPYEWVIVLCWWLFGIYMLLRMPTRLESPEQHFPG
ncbi:APC family permease [Planifilum fimeticola]